MPLAFNWSVSCFTLFRFSSIEEYLDKVVSKSSLQIKNSELNPFGLQRFFNSFHASRAVLEYCICKRGPSSIVSLILAKAFQSISPFGVTPSSIASLSDPFTRRDWTRRLQTSQLDCPISFSIVILSDIFSANI